MTRREFNTKRRQFKRQIRECTEFAREALTLAEKLPAMQQAARIREEDRQFILKNGLETIN